MVETPLFQSAHNALVFAFNASQSYERPLMNRLASSSSGPEIGLIGLEAAGQAGMIRSAVKALGPTAEAILLARLAPRAFPCPCRSACCSGDRPNAEWSEAMHWLTEYTVTALSGCLSHYPLRQGLVQKYFGAKFKLVELAEHCGLSPDTASAHATKITKLLKTQEHKAWLSVETRLAASGIIQIALEA